MSNIITIMRRELGAYFLSPIAYVVMAVFLLASGLVFGLGTFHPGMESSLRSLFDTWILFFLVAVLPMLTMRLFSEEFRSGTIESLMTVAITDVEVVLGKFFGAMAFLGFMLLALLPYAILLNIYGRLDPGLLLCNVIGLILLGALYVSIGLFFSACTKHQIVAVILSILVLVIFTFASHALGQNIEMEWPRVVLQHLSIRMHFNDFVRGLVTLNNLIFFLTTTVAILFFTVKLVEFRRWQ